jgi:hypothetical protein
MYGRAKRKIIAVSLLFLSVGILKALFHPIHYYIFSVISNGKYNRIINTEIYRIIKLPSEEYI